MRINVACNRTQQGREQSAQQSYFVYTNSNSEIRLASGLIKLNLDRCLFPLSYVECGFWEFVCLAFFSNLIPDAWAWCRDNLTLFYGSYTVLFSLLCSALKLMKLCLFSKFSWWLVWGVAVLDFVPFKAGRLSYTGVLLCLLPQARCTKAGSQVPFVVFTVGLWPPNRTWEVSGEALWGGSLVRD